MYQQEYLAHSENAGGITHKLATHLKIVAELMVGFSGKLEYQHILRITGLIHDIGKYQEDFQMYLIHGGRRGSVPHASWGAAFAKKYTQVEAAFAIDGHHKGLPNKAGLQDDWAEFDEPDHLLFSKVKNIFLKESELLENDLDYNPFKISLTERE